MRAELVEGKKLWRYTPSGTFGVQVRAERIKDSTNDPHLR